MFIVNKSCNYKYHVWKYEIEVCLAQFLGRRKVRVHISTCELNQ